MAFVGFLRSDEALHARACDLEISHKIAKLSLPHSNMDLFRKGDEVLIARTGTSTCPVDMGAACAATGICLDSDVFLLEELLKLRMGKN